MSFLKKIFGDYSQKQLKTIEPIKEAVLSLEGKYEKMSETQLRAQTDILRKRLEDGETTDDILPDAFAVCREGAWRVLGMKPYPVQVVGGIVLHQGRIAEMKTGEGKTLVATLPAYLNALSGKGVHIITVNDYLAKRDSEWMGKLYRYLGLEVGLVIHGISQENRRASYAADITYGTNNEFGFDYLRDNMVIYKENRAQRLHNFAIVDEVDSILIDEARTPLIISGAGEESSELYTIADRFAKSLKAIKVAKLDDKENLDEMYEGDYLIDEKAKTATLTPEGVEKAEKFFKIENLMDPENTEIQHHINQAIKANGIMTRDVDYVVKDGEILIVDEFTGRLMIGRRYNEGLHQAIEAKEKVTVAKESKTLATITFQNYFRLYKKLSGMTGTALTEENEFREIYNLDCISIPTNAVLARTEHPDVIYKTESAKFNAVVEQVIDCHEKGQPVLVGTVSIDKSEEISELLKKRKVPHEVLNAKFHEKEAEIVAQAGKFGSVTIATNMAGRGTDIVLGGNADFMAKHEMKRQGFSDELVAEATGFAETDDEDIVNARATYKELEEKFDKETKPEAEKVKEAGGLYIIGTERHESRRIDNQLRGRAGRQGDPGESQFFLALDDDLLRLFNGEQVQKLMDRFKVDDDMPLDARMLSSVIENAQAKVEGRNFSIRKNVLKYDDVLSAQRGRIYEQRNMVLDNADLKEYIGKMMDETVTNNVSLYINDEEQKENWNIIGLRDYYLGWVTTKDDLKFKKSELDDVSKESLDKEIREKMQKLYDEKEAEYGEKVMRELERVILLQNVDRNWMDHIDAMDQLKQGISLRSYGNQDPAIAFREEGFDMFNEMIDTIRENTVKTLMLARIRKEETAAPKREQVLKPSDTGEGGTVRNDESKKVGRNSPCPCGSGKKYKNCHGKNAGK